MTLSTSILYEHTLVKDLPGLRNLLPSPKTVIDVGAGLRPADWFGARHICIEPSVVYAEKLREEGYDVMEGTALEMLPLCPEADLILLLDVIEHMTREEGDNVLHLALMSGASVAVYTPYGFKEQDTDEWGYGEDYWQTHRSGWTPEDFPGWRILRGKEGFAAVHRSDR